MYIFYLIILKEYENLKRKFSQEKTNIKESLKLNNERVLSEEKLKSENKIQEINSDKNFILNNLLLEKEALIRKLEVFFT